jgi:hypothetical protein
LWRAEGGVSGQTRQEHSGGGVVSAVSKGWIENQISSAFLTNLQILGIKVFINLRFEPPGLHGSQKKEGRRGASSSCVASKKKKNAHRLRCTNVEQKRVAANTVI